MSRQHDVFSRVDSNFTFNRQTAVHTDPQITSFSSGCVEGTCIPKLETFPLLCPISAPLGLFPVFVKLPLRVSWSRYDLSTNVSFFQSSLDITGQVWMSMWENLLVPVGKRERSTVEETSSFLWSVVSQRWVGLDWLWLPTHLTLCAPLVGHLSVCLSVCTSLFVSYRALPNPSLPSKNSRFTFCHIFDHSLYLSLWWHSVR